MNLFRLLLLDNTKDRCSTLVNTVAEQILDIRNVCTDDDGVGGKDVDEEIQTSLYS